MIFFQIPASTEIHTLSLHDALPIYFVMELVSGVPITRFCDQRCLNLRQRLRLFAQVCQRSEEHTSELQSQSKLVCRLLLETKKPHKPLGDEARHRLRGPARCDRARV